MNQFQFHELIIPASFFRRLRLLRDALGVKHYLAPLRPHHQPIRGIMEVIGEPPMQRVLVEIFTEYANTYGRILVLVVLGVGTTAWYSFVPSGLELIDPTFKTINDYIPFLKESYTPAGFKHISFTEVNNVSENVADILNHSKPFNDINISAQGAILMSVGLAVILAIFITLELMPASSSDL